MNKSSETLSSDIASLQITAQIICVLMVESVLWGRISFSLVSVLQDGPVNIAEKVIMINYKR